MEEREFEDLARELHETRADPRPEYARELDRRAAGWLRERAARRLPSLRIAIPAAAAGAVAAVVIALAVSGGGGEERAAQLAVTVIPEHGAAEALGAPLDKSRDSAAGSLAEGGFAPPAHRRVDPGEPISLRYFFTAPTSGTVELAGREAELEVPQGAGRVQVSTDGLPAGTHRLEIAVPAAPLYRERIEIGS
jgi:hypothetical protein